MKSPTLPLIATALLLGTSASQAGSEIPLGTMNRVNVALTCQQPENEATVNDNTRTRMERLRLETTRLSNVQILLAMQNQELPSDIRGWALVEIVDVDGDSVGIFAYKHGYSPVALPTNLLSYMPPAAVVESYSTTFNYDAGANTQDDRRSTGIANWIIDGKTLSGPMVCTSRLRSRRNVDLTEMWTIATWSSNLSGLTAGEPNVYATGRVTSSGGGSLIDISKFLNALAD